MGKTATVARVFNKAPWHTGTETAVIYRDERWDYAELTSRVVARVRRLQGQGLSSGQVVLAADEPGPDLIVMQFALARCGSALLPVEPTLSTEQRGAWIRAAGAEWHWTGKQGGRLVPTRVSTAKRAAPQARVALVMKTSGSSGAPRAALITPSNVLHSCATTNRLLDLEPGDRWLCCLPRQHVGGLAIGYRCALAGATLVIHDGFDAERVRADLERARITHLSLVPPTLSRLLALDVPPPRDLRVLLVGGQALHHSLAHQALARGWPLRVTYGMTETFSQIATSGPLQTPPEPGVIGPPLVGVEIDCPPAGAPPDLIRVRGAMVMAGYTNPERAPGLGLTAEGWLVTSDLGRWTSDGDLCVLGRADEILVIGGHNVLPAHVEQRLLDAPGVTAAVVTSLAEPVWGHSLAAAYTGTIDSEDLDRWCREHLASPQRPRRLHRCEQLPLLPTGKYDRAQIRRLLDSG